MIVILHYPYTDRYGKSKLRPGLVIGTPKGDDLIIMKISTNKRINTVGITNEDFETGSLNHDSFVLFGNVITAHKKKILEVAGKINEAKYKEIIGRLIGIIS